MKHKSRLISNRRVCLDNAGFTQLHPAQRESEFSTLNRLCDGGEDGESDKERERGLAARSCACAPPVCRPIVPAGVFADSVP